MDLHVVILLSVDQVNADHHALVPAQLRETASLPHADDGTAPEGERVLMVVEWDLLQRDARLRT